MIWTCGFSDICRESSKHSWMFSRIVSVQRVIYSARSVTSSNKLRIGKGEACLLVATQNQSVTSGLNWLSWTWLLGFPLWVACTVFRSFWFFLWKLKSPNWLWFSGCEPKSNIDTKYCICQTVGKEGIYFTYIMSLHYELPAVLSVLLDVSHRNEVLLLETDAANCSKMTLPSCSSMAQWGPIVFAHHEKQLSVRVCNCLVEIAGILMQQIKRAAIWWLST